MPKKLFHNLVWIVLLLSEPATAQFGFPGMRDTTFNLGGQYGLSSNPINPAPGEASNHMIRALAAQPDGKAVVAGEFTSFNGKLQNRIVRLLQDGTVDSSFQIGSGTNVPITMLLLQPDGKVIIGGDFMTFNGTQRVRLARLLPNGQIDTTFNPGSSANNTIQSIALLPNGKLMIAGRFTSVQGVACNRIARLNANGSLDASFNPGTAANGEILAMVIQPDGKIMIAGNFTSYNGALRNRIARIEANGNMDTTFNPGAGSNDPISSIGLLPNGKMFVSGSFQQFNGRQIRFLVRLNSDGSIDTTANIGTGMNGVCSAITILPDGKALLNGFFSEINGATRYDMARLNQDGSLDTTFSVGTASMRAPTFNAGSLFTHAVQPDGRILIGGAFVEFNGLGRNSISRLLANGSHDLTFNPRIGPDNPVFSFARLPDGRMYVAGSFVSFNDLPYKYIVRLFPDGRIDTSFNTGSGPNYVIVSVVLQPDGKVLIGGYFSAINGIPRNYIARLNQDGSLDTTFNPGSGPNSVVLGTLLQPDGKILINGTFVSVNGVARNYVARLHANGQLDSGFITGTFWGSSNFLLVREMALQPDGKILVGGDFTSYNALSRGRILRLNSDGSLDLTFNSSTGASGIIHAISLQPDGKILIGGEFAFYNSSGRSRIARLNIDGTPDPSFIFAGGANQTVRTIAVQSDGLILLGGDFTRINGVSRNRIARMLPNGVLDTTYNQGVGLNESPLRIVLQPDGKALVGGRFTTYNGSFVPRIMRIFGGTCASLVSNTTSSAPICVGSSKVLQGTPGGNWVIASGPGNIVGNTYIASGGVGLVSVFNITANCSSPLVTFAVNSNPIAPTLVTPTPICAGQRATISPTTGGTSYRFFADSISTIPLPGGDSVTSFTTPPLGATTTYYVSSLSSTGCESSMRSAVTINVNPVPVIGIVQVGDTLLADSMPGTYQWFRDEVAIVGANTNYFVPNQSGSHTVAFTTTQGCSDTSNAINVIMANVNEVQKNQFRWTTFPVPFNELLNIEADQPFSYTLFDLRGAVLLQGKTDRTEVALSTAYLASGVYMFRIEVNGQIAYRRVIKQDGL